MRRCQGNHRLHAHLLMAAAVILGMTATASAAPPDTMFGGLERTAMDSLSDGDGLLPGHLDLETVWSQHARVVLDGEARPTLVLAVEYRDLEGLSARDSLVGGDGAGTPQLAYAYDAWCGGKKTDVLGVVALFSDGVEARSWGIYGGEHPVWAHIVDNFVLVFLPTNQDCDLGRGIEGLRVESEVDVPEVDCLGECAHETEALGWMRVGPLQDGVYDRNGTLLPPEEGEEPAADQEPPGEAAPPDRGQPMSQGEQDELPERAAASVSSQRAVPAVASLAVVLAFVAVAALARRPAL